MPKRTNDFQRLIVVIEQALASAGASVAESPMVVNRALGDETDVDIIITHRVGGRDVRTAIECRDHRREQG